MIALDTNMLVRALVADHPEQVAVVRRLVADETVFVPRTVLLETEWVLRARYKREPAELLHFFRMLLETDDTVVESAEEVSNALDWNERGADFADALHLARSVYLGSLNQWRRGRSIGGSGVDSVQWLRPH